MTMALRVAVLSFLWIALIHTGEFGTDDTDARLRMAHAWWTGGKEVSPSRLAPASREDFSRGVQGVNGARYIYYDPGQALLMLPGDWIATKLHHFFQQSDLKAFRLQVVDWLTFVPLNVALILACFWLLRLFGFEESLAALSSMLLLLGTTVLFYAQVPFQNNQVLLCVTIAFATILAWTHNPRGRFLTLSGAALGAAVLLRTTAVIHVFVVGVFLLRCLLLKSRDRREFCADVGYWCAGLVPLVLIGRVFDFARYGSLWTTGQSTWIQQLNSDPIYAGLPSLPSNFPFVNDPHIGIFGVLFSPAKSIFIYDPLLLPCLVVAVLAWKTLTPYLRWYLALAVVDLGLNIALTSRLDFWHGDWSWGARYHVTSVQILLIPLLALLLQRALTAAPRVAKALLGFVAVAVLLQAIAVAMPVGLEIAQENVEHPTYCITSLWNSPLEFRLGNRIKNLLCLADSSLSMRCPAAVAARTKTVPSGECSDDLQTLTVANELAFQPFNSREFRLGSPWWPLAWVLTLLVAATATGIWFHSVRKRLIARANHGNSSVS